MEQIDDHLSVTLPSSVRRSTTIQGNVLFNICTYISGIGQGRVTSNLQGAPIDDAVFVTDKEAVEMVR